MDVVAEERFVYRKAMSLLGPKRKVVDGWLPILGVIC